MSQPATNERSDPLTRVLLVEDNLGDADLIIAQLEADPLAWAFEVAQVGRLEDALARVGEGGVDLVILDLTLPDASQLMGLDAIRKQAPGLPVVVLTGSADLYAGIAALNAGAQDFLLKDELEGRYLVRALRYAHERSIFSERERLLSEARAAGRTAERMARRASLVAGAGAILATSFDLEKTLGAVARLVVEDVAQFCLIECRIKGVRESAIRVQAHADPRRDARLREIRRACAGTGGSAAGTPGASGDERAAALLIAVPDDLLAAWASSPEEREALRALDLGAGLVVPVVGHGRVRGTLALFNSLGQSPLGDADLSLAEDLAQRVGVAAANASLYVEAREAIGVRDEFLSIAAHELRTPLTALDLQVRAIQRAIEKGEAGPMISERAGRARGNMSRLARLVDNLLDVSRILIGRMTLEREKLDLLEIVSGVIAQFREAASSLSLELRLETDGAPVRGSWDRLRIEQVMTNLLSNALKYGENRPVTVRVHRGDASVSVEVEDRGIGIARENLARIFERFERAVSTRHYGGLGLGLYVSREIIREHGGTIDVTSSPGEGATFRVTLPL